MTRMQRSGTLTRFVSTLSAWLFMGCSDAAKSATALVSVDTLAGTVVVNTSREADSISVLELDLEMRIPSRDEDAYTFARVTSLAPDAEGGIYVWDAQLSELRSYDHTGEFKRRIGRRGEGPGEYLAANGVVVLRDGTVLLWDPRRRRISRFTNQGEVLPPWSLATRLLTSMPPVVDTAGNVYVRESLPAPNDEKDARGREGLLRLSPQGVVVESLPVPQRFDPPVPLVARNGGLVTSVSRPFAGAPLWAMSPMGYFVTASADAYRITLHRTNELPVRIERDVTPMAVTAQEARAIEDSIMRRMRRVDPAWQWSGENLPAHKPMFRALLVAEDGAVWAARNVDRALAAGGDRDGSSDGAAVDPIVFDIFRPDGNFVGVLRISPSTWILHVGADAIWGVELDSLDVPRVSKWSLRRARP